ncbi:putative DNA helicase chromatin remodeling SNF2 family [Helianthus annuus]|nr:putative DNA helicase chromatin remodeling SNF2 family [Helianthus annuus]
MGKIFGQSRSILISTLRSLFQKGNHHIKQPATSPDSVINERFIEQKKPVKISQHVDVENTSSSSGDEVPLFSLSHPRFIRFSLPSEIAKKLYPHQLEGVKWLWTLHCKGKGGILGDDMGLGKTMQICAFLAGLFHSNLIKRVLIVVPKTLLPHWMKELGVVNLSGKTRV